MNLGIIGAGATGLTAAYDAVKAGHTVTVLEAADELGGLAASIPVGGTPLERYYHHIFRSDTAIIELIEELGLGGDLHFHKPTTAVFRDGKLHPFSTPLEMLRFPSFSVLDGIRFGASSAALKLVRNGERFNDRTALSWLRRWAGRGATASVSEPLLRGKFGDRAEEVSMAWLWARVHCRTFELGYMAGGFERVYAALHDAVGRARRQGRVRQGGRHDPPARGRRAGHRHHQGRRELRVRPADRHHPAARLRQGRRRPRRRRGLAQPVPRRDLLHPGAGPQRDPVLLAQHQRPGLPVPRGRRATNMVDKAEYGDRHILYVGNYVERDDWRFTTDPAELLERFIPYLQKLNPEFDRSWIQKWHFSRAPFAQPVVTPEYRALIPGHATHLSRVTLATMAQIYPQDRGQSYSVALAHRVTELIGAS